MIHAALGLPASRWPLDVGGAVRSGVVACWPRLDARVPTLAVLSDVRTGLPGGADERDGGDAAAAFLFGGDSDAPVLAELVAVGATTDEFLDRWRTPGAPASRVWEERFGEHVYGPLVDAAFADALKQAGLSPGDVDHLVVAGPGGPGREGVRRQRRCPGRGGDRRPHSRHRQRRNGPARSCCWPRRSTGPSRARPSLSWSWPTAPPCCCSVPPTPSPRTAPTRPWRLRSRAGNDGLRYATFLNWRGLLPKSRPAGPTRRARPPRRRTARERYKYGFVGSRCDQCAAVHLPPARVCVKCGASTA